MSRIIAIDVGAGTADIVIRDTGEPPENSVKLVVPSRTHVVAAQIREATRRGSAVLFTGPTMGGGADTRAMKAHTAERLPFLATETAARSFADDLDWTRALGAEIVGDDEARGLAARGSLAARKAGAGEGARELVHVESGDIDAPRLLRALAAVGVHPDFTAIAVAVQDHGFDPSGSNRVLRFGLWERAVRERRSLPELFYWVDENEGPVGTSAGAPRDVTGAAAGTGADGPRRGIPAVLTRLRAAAGCAAGLGDGAGIPLLAGDTGPAALLGALADHDASAPDPESATVLVNVGNGHTVAAVARAGRLLGIYEHHTGMLSRERLTDHLHRFLAEDLEAAEVREDGGHGAILAHPIPWPSRILVTGPNRRLLQGSGLPASYPAPWGDMMIAGAVGLVRAMCEDDA